MIGKPTVLEWEVSEAGRRTRDQVFFAMLWNFIGANSGNFQAKVDLEAMIARDPDNSYGEYEEKTITNAYICFVLS